MAKVLITLLIVIASGSAIHPAKAALLPPVTVNGLEWLQPLDFIDSTWTDVSAVCNSSTGECNGSLAGFDVTGWTWASVDDLNVLLSTYFNEAFGPGPDSKSLHYSEAPAVYAFLYDFQYTGTYCSSIAFCHFNLEGWTRTAVGSAGYIGSLKTDFSTFYEAFAGGTVGTDSSSPSPLPQGAWLYRVDVSAPATLGLCMGGLAALAFSRRTRQI